MKLTFSLSLFLFFQIFSAGRRPPCRQPRDPAGCRKWSGRWQYSRLHERQRLVHLCLQPGARDGGKHLVAAFRAVRSRTKRESHPRPTNQQVQGLRLRHHDQLRRVSGGDPIAQRIHSGQQSTPSQLQN